MSAHSSKFELPLLRGPLSSNLLESADTFSDPSYIIRDVPKHKMNIKYSSKVNDKSKSWEPFGS